MILSFWVFFFALTVIYTRNRARMNDKNKEQFGQKDVVEPMEEKKTFTPDKD